MAAVRGNEPLRRNGSSYYWELRVLDKIFGTSLMFGVCTKHQQLSKNSYCNIVGLDHNGWSLSHKGFVWHSGQHRKFAEPFPMYDVTVGVLFDTARGELSFFVVSHRFLFASLPPPTGYSHHNSSPPTERKQPRRSLHQPQ